MTKLIPMEEAARLLGISVDRLSELRSNNEVFGYRDGSNWKFKLTELERVADELGLRVNTGDALDEELDESSGTGFEMTDSAKEMLLSGSSSKKLSDSFDVEPDSVEYMEDSSEELFQDSAKLAGGTSASDIDLGEDDDAIDLMDSGRLTRGSGKNFRDSDSMGMGDSDIVPSDDNVIDDDEEELSFGASSLRLASESSKKLQDELNDPASVLDDEQTDKKKSPSDTGKMLGDDELMMSEDDLFSDDLSINDSSSFEESSELSSDFTDSEDVVMDDSDSSTEIRLEANESGINLSANESGISLSDEPLELGGSDIDALELPEDDDDMIILDQAAGGDEAALMQEDEFNLTPLADSLDEDESTGSQVIALEDSEIYADESAGSLLGAEEFEAQPAMLDDGLDGDFDGAYGIPGQMMVPAGSAALPEAPYSMWQVISLGMVASLLMAGGMVAYGLAQNMWMPEDQIIGSSVLNFFLRMTGMN